MPLALCRWRAALIMVGLLAIPGSGCSRSGKELLGLTAVFDRTPIIYDNGQATIPLTLSIQNVGTVPLRVLNVDGGCSCRHVDISGFPVIVGPGQSYRLGVDMASHSLSGSDRYVFRRRQIGAASTFRSRWSRLLETV